jgi:transketolase
MGEQVTYSLSEAIQETTAGTHLSHFEKAAFDSVANCSGGTSQDRAALYALLARFNTLYMVAKAGSGHLGSSFSSMDLVVWLHTNVLRQGDRYFSSKGHDSPGLYALQTSLGILPFENIHKLRRLEGLPGHPDVVTPGAWTNTGALGMGISKAKGFVFADRLQGQRGQRIFVMTGDGELQEGQIWESLASAVYEKMGEITVIVDHNKIQSDTHVAKVSDLGDLEQKFRAFGWEVRRCDGHDYAAFGGILDEFAKIADRPKILIADTVKGSGVSFMEHTAMAPDQEYYRFHSGAPSPEDYRRAAVELLEKIARAAEKLGLALPSPVAVDIDPLVAPENAQRMIPAYSAALLKQAEQRKDIVALDADLILDTGLIPFKEKFPERFVECGIAEQDMVSRAGAMALSGLLPVVHSFACFLTPRPNEQIYNASTERTRIIYVGSLAGLVPGGPGHSHQAVRDIAALSGVPGFVMVEPATPRQVEEALDWCLNEAKGSTYLRLVSIPCEYRAEMQSQEKLVFGRGCVLREGSDVAVITYGPVMLPEALKAADTLQQEGVSVRVINLPWLNAVDRDWLVSAIKGARVVVTLDNHYIEGGQGQFLRSELCGSLDAGVSVVAMGVSEIPACGRNAEVLRHHGLDAEGVAQRIRGALNN